MSSFGHLDAAFTDAVQAGLRALRDQQYDYALACLERAHIIGQSSLLRHLRVHGLMLRVAWHRRDASEALAQLLRIALVPMGHLTGRLPSGNPGTRRVSAFRSMPLDPELAALMRCDQDGRRGASSTSRSS